MTIRGVKMVMHQVVDGKDMIVLYLTNEILFVDTLHAQVIIMSDSVVIIK